MRFPVAMVAALIPAVSIAQNAATPADLVLVNARIYTVDENRPIAEALAVRGGRIAFVGSAQGALAMRGPNTQLVNAGGNTVIPGIADAHVHLYNLGISLRTVNLEGTKSYEQVIALIAAKAATVPAGTWITGRGWDQNDWPDTKLPTHDALSKAVPNHPVFVGRVDGHAALANAAAMKLAGVTATTKDPEGGRIERGAGGAPTGVFVDNATALVASKVPGPTRDEARDAILAAVKEANRWGLTSVHDAGVSSQVIDLYEELAKAGQYSLRNYVMINGDDSTLARYFRRGPQSALYNSTLWIRAIKLVADGALGSRGAALLDPYSDAPNNSGLITTPMARVQDVAVRALRNGFQLNVHAIGDAGNRMVLDAFEGALGQVPSSDHRFRIEHAQIIHHDDVPRFAKLDVIPSMQATHQTSDMYWAPNRLGFARLNGAYAWRTLLNTGVVIPNGTDFPVEAVNPMLTFHSAVTRQDANNYPTGGWFPEERMTREEALKSITLWPAYAAFQEKEMGSLTAGKLADFVVLDRDIMTVPPEQLVGTQVLVTFIGGKSVYEKK